MANIKKPTCWRECQSQLDHRPVGTGRRVSGCFPKFQNNVVVSCSRIQMFNILLRGRKNADCGAWRQNQERHNLHCRNHEKVQRSRRHCTTLRPSQGMSSIFLRKMPLSFSSISPSFVYIFALYRLSMALLRTETCSKLTYVVFRSLGLLTTNVLC